MFYFFAPFSGLLLETLNCNVKCNHIFLALMCTMRPWVRQNGASALRIVQTFTSSTKMKRQQLEKLWNVRCDLWGVLWLFQASWQRRECSQFLIILVGKKSPRVTAAQCSAIFLPVPYFSTLSPFVLFFLTVYVLPQSLYSPSSLHFCLLLSFIPFVFIPVSSLCLPQLLSTVFHWALCECCPDCG